MKYVFRNPVYKTLALLVDFAGRFLFFARRRISQNFSPKKILIVRLDHLGDILSTIAIPKALKEHFDGVKVHFLTNSTGEALVSNNPFVDHVWVFNPKWYARESKSVNRGMRYAEVLRTLRHEKFDLAFSLRGDIRENWLLRMAGIRPSVGYGITGGGFLLDIEATYPWQVHESERTFELLRRVGVHIKKLTPQIYFLDAEKRRFADDLISSGVQGDGWIGFQVDAGTPAKRWPLENLDRFISLLETEHSELKMVFLGSDAKTAEWLERRLAQRPDKNRVSLVGKTGLRYLFYVLKSVKCFIGPDSGPGHISADVFGHPTLFLYSGTNIFEEWRSLSQNSHFLHSEVACSPCGLTLCPVKGHPCMSGISVESVFEWLKERVHV